MTRFYNWCLDFFRPPLKEGVVIEKIIIPEGVPRMVIVGGLPVPVGRGATTLSIKFEHGNRRRVVQVSSECFKRYNVGDHIRFDN